jgi:hypothetical protein
MLPASTLPLGAADCEIVGGGWLVQPINAWSSLAYAAVGMVLITSTSQAPRSDRTLRVAFGVLMVATGIGSFLYHGPQPAAAGFAHDITFLAMLWFLILMNPASAYGVPRPHAWIALASVTAAASAVLIASPDSTNVLTGISIVALITSDLLLRRIGGINGRWYAAALILFGASLVFNLLGRSSTATCDPDTLIQFHALWHVLSAAAFGAYYVATTVPRDQEPSP